MTVVLSELFIAMRKSSLIDTVSRPAATRQDVQRIIGDVDEFKLLEILSLRPSVSELEEAAIWSRGDGDILGKTGRPLTGVAAQLFDILTADEEEESRPPAR